MKITKHFINLHGAELEVECIFGTGTTFTFDLPVQEAVSFNEDMMVSNLDDSLYVEKENSSLNIHHQHPTEQIKGNYLLQKMKM